ncbi:MAG: hypothetical protein NT062_31550 [Proteobacteria bacterium]|nr:hypothetical protein [Pseudomonadota bacterium]
MGSRSGELAMRPLPAVLLDLHEELATGKLVLRRGRISKTVELVNGNPVSSTSTPRDETLGHFLVNSGMITEDQHRGAVAHAAAHGAKLGEALVTMGVFDVAQLIDQLGKQARHKIVQALRWPQGAWRFDDSEPLEGIQLKMVEVVIGGLRETSIELDRLHRLDAQTFVLTERGTRIKHELRRAFGDQVMAALAAPIAITEIEKLFADRGEARIAVDAMLLCDALAAHVDDAGLGLGLVGATPEPVVGRAPTRPLVAGSSLFDLLFEDLGGAGEGAAPLDFFDEDAGVSTAELTATNTDRELTASVRKLVTAEHQRVRGADHYAVLMIGRRATPAEIDASHGIRTTLLARDTADVVDPKDRQRVDEIRASYDAAKKLLLDDRQRASYDRELAGGELVQAPPAINVELAFRVAEELMSKRQWPQAIGHLKTVLAQAPTEADFHAALGWAEWMASGETPEGADATRAHLAAALAIDLDHAGAHDYIGRVEAKLGTDDTEALFHLERAIDLDPARTDAMLAIETLLVGRGELRRLERVLKRLLFRLRGRGTAVEGKTWARLARLYFDHLDDPTAGAAAASNARRIAPRDSDVAALQARGELRPDAGQHEPLRAGWHEALRDPHSGATLVRKAAASGHADAAFLAASTMVALDTADASMAALYEAHRVRGVVVPTQALDRDQWAMLRHRDDTVELGALIELVAPAVHALAPMLPADAELDPSQLVTDAEVPPAFAKLRARYATLLGVAPAPVYAKVELGLQIHVVATDPPVLIAGDEALTAPERPELVFRLARAMTYLWPGRAVGASRPGRVLRAIVLAIFREAADSQIGSDEPLADAATRAIEVLPEKQRLQARGAALRLLSRGAGLNLSVWGRALSRTADRAGLLLCGDVPAAFAGAKEVGELERDLVEFSYSAAHVHLREQLGLRT